MKTNLPVLVLATLMLFFQGNYAAAAGTNCPSDSGAAAGAWNAQSCGDAPSASPAANSADMYLAGDSDRGCCILKTPRAKCVYTNQAFCKRKAKQANVNFEFHKGVECKTISACR